MMAALLDDGHSVGYFSSQDSIRFARETQRSYHRLNAELARRRDAELAELAEDYCMTCETIFGYRVVKSSPWISFLSKREPYWPMRVIDDPRRHGSTTLRLGPGESVADWCSQSLFVRAMRMQYAALNARREATYEAELVPLSMPVAPKLTFETIRQVKEWCEGLGLSKWEKQNAPRYRKLLPGELIIEGDEFADGPAWVTVDASIGRRVREMYGARYRRKLTN